MKKTFPLFLFFFSCCLTVAYTQIVFQKTYGGADLDEGEFIYPTNDSCYITSVASKVAKVL